MFEVGRSLTFDNANSHVDAGLRAIQQGETAFDFAAVTTVDSSAVATMLAWQRAARGTGKALAFSSVPANLGSLISLYDTADLLVTSSATDSAPSVT
tara:strand:- start:92536 stop:92826 length:291 start_codon:yes stop_codon:yes gene_type:complete